jgi:hypothetical protein
MSKNLVIAAGAFLVVAAMYFGYGWLFAEQPSSPQELAQTALEADSANEREMAVAQLSGLGRESTEHLQRVLAKGNSPSVRATAIQGLAKQWDYDSMDPIIDALNDDDPLVRGRAGRAVERMLGMQFGLRHDAPVEERKAKIKLVRTAWKQMKTSEVFENWKQRLAQKQNP